MGAELQDSDGRTGCVPSSADYGLRSVEDTEVVREVSARSAVLAIMLSVHHHRAAGGALRLPPLHALRRFLACSSFAAENAATFRTSHSTTSSSSPFRLA
ncbi:hypothetical protein GCM10010842_37720 [Deinococcus daejeonensis]|uniref:Uncharacterized protein n=1 Tax=Deinococcus daejeonensis TaxID=1007098 RepID=A0ABQ2JHV8_9DEIO|nr:hypothetical protein GCM10010842_37720 [Deinococcus daejeonensis]